MTGIYWFKNDLRLEDNPAFNLACDKCTNLISVYIFDPQLLEDTSFGFPRIGPYRLKFLFESLIDLREQLRSKGSELHLLLGNPLKLIPEIAEKFKGEVFCSDDIAHDERELLATLESKVKLHRKGLFTLYSIDDLPFEMEDLPHVFTDFRKEIEKSCPEPQTIKAPDFTPDTPVIDIEDQWDMLSALIPEVEVVEHSAFPFRGGSSAALDRLNGYFWESDAIADYKQTRNGLLGADYSSKFSAWLANGSISPRSIYASLKKYETERTTNQSTYWLYFELLWRDFFQYTALKHGNKLFLKHGLKGRSEHNWKLDHHVFERWKSGQTKEDFVNANMIELRETGWMSNRGRQNVASYLVHDLNLDWRIGAAWFEFMLIDFDPASNYGNWAYVAGVGNDPRPQRKFNIKRQQDMYDADRSFTNLWTHEFA